MVGRCYIGNIQLCLYVTTSAGITVIIPRINFCVDLGSTGYPFGLAMKVVAGKNKKSVGSAVQRASSCGLGGHGGVRSKADIGKIKR